MELNKSGRGKQPGRIELVQFDQLSTPLNLLILSSFNSTRDAFETIADLFNSSNASKARMPEAKKHFTAVASIPKAVAQYGMHPRERTLR